MNRHIEANKERTIKNQSGIKANKMLIDDNKRDIEDIKRNSVPFVVFESTQARSDRIIHRLIVVLIVVVALLFISNAVWIYAWNSTDRGMSISNDTKVIGSEVSG